MQVICPKYAGLVHICEYCGAILQYTASDIYEKYYIYCPVCKEKQRCALVAGYDGVVRPPETQTNEEVKTISG